jgi:Acetyltransferase (GNAT) domain
MDYNKVSKSEWEEITLKSDNANFFHSPIWAKIVEKTWNYRTATRLYHINGKEILIPMMQANILGFKILTNIPNNSDAGGLFSESEITTDDFKSIVNNIVGGRNLSFSLTLPPFMKLSSDSSIIKENWKLNDEYAYTQLLELEGKNYENIWKNDFHRKARQKVRKAKKTGVEIREGASLKDFKTFYDIYATEASQKWGYETPQIPFKLFKNLYKHGSNHVKLNLAIKDDKTIGGTISFPYSKTFYVFMSAYLLEYGPSNPTSLLFNESIKQACQENYNYVNFGTSGNLRNVRKIKEKFGAGKVEISRYRVYSNLGKMVSEINRKLRVYSNVAEVQNKINKLRFTNLSGGRRI